ncbi:MAG: hypothetical protein J0H20_13430, partial [Rhizobiales bacterium]|nr:hypothetical protein [Hyphomicrobiales bacterium]
DDEWLTTLRAEIAARYRHTSEEELATRLLALMGVPTAAAVDGAAFAPARLGRNGGEAAAALPAL